DSTQGSSSGLSDGAIAGIVIGAVAGVALIAALVYFLYIRNTGRSKDPMPGNNSIWNLFRANDQHDLKQHKLLISNHSEQTCSPSGGWYFPLGQGHSDNSPSKIDKVAYSSLNFNVQESKKPTSASPSLTASETVYSEVKKK
ncbi:Carcinoembryonic antigen-related cell adhesion molecule 1, partial [Camelus dromedarius]